VDADTVTESDHSEGTARRRRDAAATRLALLGAARRLVAEHGVEGTSTRDVANAIGVNQALVYRYFGSKEKLLAEAVSTGMPVQDDLMEQVPLHVLPRVLLDRVLDATAGKADQPGGFSAWVTAANDETIRALIRERVDVAFGTQLAARLDEPDAALRAELFAALLTGIGFLREKVGTPALTGADRDTLGHYVDELAAALFAR
jgi:AcrR family transcriptional regulator